MNGLFPTIDIRPTIGWVFIGLLAGTALYGVTLLQTVIYLRSSQKDSKWLISLVALVTSLDTVSVILIAHGMYVWVIVDYDQPLKLLDVSWSVEAEPAFSGTIALCTHLFMAWRIYVLTPGLWPVALFIAMTSLLPFSVAMAAVASLFSLRIQAQCQIGGRMQTLILMGSVSTAVLDILIAATLCTQIYLRGSYARSSNEKTKKMIDLIILYLVSTNLTTSMISFATMISGIVDKDSLRCEGFNVLIAKAYTNTFLAQLNARDMIRERGDASTMRVHGEKKLAGSSNLLYSKTAKV